MRVLISEVAEGDLAQIYFYLVSHDDPETAERFRIRTEKALNQLGQHPAIGPQPGWTSRHKTLRFWVISRSSYIIYYEIKGEDVSIERVLDGRRDVRRIIEFSMAESPDETD